MCNFQVDDFVLLRLPAYSYKNYEVAFLTSALETDFFRSAIFFASRSFYDELQKNSFDYGKLNVQAQISLWKYFNRMCYRSLPYGLFASFSTAKWGEFPSSIPVAGPGVVYACPDFKMLFDYIQSVPAASLSDLKYFPNNTLYQSSQQLRLITETYLPLRKYGIQEIKCTRVLRKVLKYAAEGRTRAELYCFLRLSYDNHDLVEAYLQSLVAAQVLTTELSANVTGIGYSERMRDLFANHPGVDQRYFTSRQIPLQHQQQPMHKLRAYVEEVASLPTENPSYILYEKELAGDIPAQVKPNLLALLSDLNKLCPSGDIDIMVVFRQAFVQRYQQREVPLMEVLDPGTGIGYEQLATAPTDAEENYIRDLRTAAKQRQQENWGPIQQLILKKWLDYQREGRSHIKIDATDLDELADCTDQLPPGFFVLFKIIDKKLWIDQLGGVSGIELSARFARRGTAMTESLKKVCNHEIQLNDEYLFAEIDWSPNDRSANINQRCHFYNSEIPILTYAGIESDRTIFLNDLRVSVIQNRVMLRSVKHNRYIIPRLSSAYNYKICNIAVFRFLCDLQFQGIKTNLGFSLPALFPGMPFYPRVILRDTVISPATWILNEAQIQELKNGDYMLLARLGLPKYFALQEGDNFLVFRKYHIEDFNLLVKCIQQSKSVTFREHHIEQDAIIQNERRQPLHVQLVTCLLNRNKSYPSPPGHQHINRILSSKLHQRIFLPGDGWLYIKLYTHDALTDEILLDLILPLLRKYKKHQSGFKWFYIRYQDPAHHLRLRFFTGSESYHVLLTDLMQKFKPLVASGRIADIMVESYQRELEKYGAEIIEEIEAFFFADTEFILDIFNLNPLSTTFKLCLAITSCVKIFHIFYEGQQDYLHMVTRVLDKLTVELNVSKETRRRLDLRYRSIQQKLYKNNSYKITPYAERTYLNTLKRLKAKTLHWQEDQRFYLLNNLVHMHINRIFDHEPRQHEIIVYHFMRKYQQYLNHTASGVIL
jgi:thiopeptide-type bacteriocin biosynthesis protein